MCKISENIREVDHQDENNSNCANRDEIDALYHKEELREIFKEEYERLLNDNGFIRQNLEGRFPHRITVSSSVSLNQLWRHLDRINCSFLPQKSQISNSEVSEEGSSNPGLNTAGSQKLQFMKLKMAIVDCQSPNLSTERKESEEESEFASIDSQGEDEDYLSAEFSEVEERIDKINHLATGTSDLSNNEDGSEQLAESDTPSDDAAQDEDPKHNPELKAWYLRGEVKNNERPLNSLIEKELEFAVNQKIVPKAKELTEEIETLLKQRVKDQVFNDVIPRSDGRREKINNVYQAQIQLNSEKSKKNLETIYEEEFGSNKDNIEQTVVSELKQKHEEIETKMNNLFAELDLICHFNLSSNNFENLKHKMHNENNKSSNMLNRTSNLPNDLSDAKQNEIPINFATISASALENSIDSTKSNSLDNRKLQDYPNKLLPPISSSSSHRKLNDAEQLKRREKRLIKIKKQAKNNERIRRVKQKNPEMPMKTVKENIRLQKGRYFSSTKNNLKKSPSSHKTKLTTSFASKL
ncbi:MAG: u3 small nucleolar ribonucleoprotein MPP10 [Marteilia pararefringens]